LLATLRGQETLVTRLGHMGGDVESLGAEGYVVTYSGGSTAGSDYRAIGSGPLETSSDYRDAGGRPQETEAVHRGTKAAEETSNSDDRV
ncbi:hypothetical protein Tco_0749438, partial [Tanacetum coccineum]